MNGFALQPGLFLGVRQGTGWLPAKIKKRERFLHLYSEISFGLGRFGQSGPQAVLAGLASVFWTLSWPDPGPKPFPFLFFQPMAKSAERPDSRPKPFSVPVFYFLFFRGGEGREGSPRPRARGDPPPPTFWGTKNRPVVFQWFGKLLGVRARGGVRFQFFM